MARETEKTAIFGLITGTNRGAKFVSSRGIKWNEKLTCSYIDEMLAR